MAYAEIFAIALLAAYVQASVGFGYALLFVPIAAFVVTPSEAIAVSIVGSGLISLLLYIEYQPRTPLRATLPLAIPTLAAAPFGLALLVVANEAVLRLLIGVAVFASAIVNLRHPSSGGEQRENRIGFQIAAGTLSGLMRGSVSMGGPPVVLYEHWIGGGQTAIRSRMFAFLTWTGVPTIGLAALSGVLEREVWLYSLAAVAALPLGVVAGRLTRHRISEDVFARASMGLLGGTAMLAALGAGLSLAR